MKVSIIGATGYGGLELLRILTQHPYVEIASIHSDSVSGQEVAALFPHLKRVLKLEQFEEVDPDLVMCKSDLVFLATPSGISKKIAIPFIKERFPVIDLSGDFRLPTKASYEKWYKQPAEHEAYLGEAVYGLAEFKEKSNIQLVANPGCYATAIILGLAPLIRQKLIDPNMIIVDAKSGLSGAGKQLSVGSHYVNVNDNMCVYKVNQHQHIPEILQQFQKWDQNVSAIQLTTSLIPVTRGIFANLYVKPKEPLTEQALHYFYKKEYERKHFVRVQEMGCFPNLKQVIGSNFCDIGVTYNPVTQLISVVSVLDNLVKGAAGQAVQNLNLIAGFPEETGLNMVPIYP